MGWYKTGTIAVTNNSTAVTGTGTAWIANASAGMGLRGPNRELYEIASVTSDTTLVLATAYSGSTATGQAYSLLPTQDYVRELAAQAATLVSDYSTIKNNAGQGKFGNGTATLPGVNFGGTGNGLYLAATNEVAVSTNGVQRLRVDATGRLLFNGNGVLSVAAGTDSLYIGGGATNPLETNIQATNIARIWTTGTERLRVDASGNTGLSVVPKAWQGPGYLELLNSRAISFQGVAGDMLTNAYYDGAWKHSTTNVAARYHQNTGFHRFYTAASGTAGATASWTERLTIAATGEVGIGNSSPNSKLDVAGSVALTGDVNLKGDAPVRITWNRVDKYANWIECDGVAGNNFMRFAAGNAEAMRINSSGNVGIGGTPSPAFRLHTFGGFVRFENAGATNVLQLASSNGVSEFGSDPTGLYIKAPDTLITRFINGGTERARITSTGNVGIGTTTPNYSGYGAAVRAITVKGAGTYGAIEIATDAALANGSVLGELSFVNAGASIGKSAAAILASQEGTNAGSPGASMRFFTRTDGSSIAERMRIDSTGLVGIGTANPGAALDVAGQLSRLTHDNAVFRLRSATTPANYGQLAIDTTGTTYLDSGTGSLYLGTLTAQSVIFRTNSTERVRLTQAGNFGVGTTNPTAKLHVYQASGASSLTIENGATTTGNFAQFMLSTGTAAWQFGSEAGSGRFYVYNNTAASDQMRLSGGANSRVDLIALGTAPVSLMTGGFDRLHVTSGGNVGISTSSPTAMLDVNSDVVRVRTAKTPTSATAAGNAGDICWDANYMYVCVAANTWKRSALATW